MVIDLVIETFLYLLYWVVLGSDMPSLFEIIGYSIAVQLLKVCGLLEFPIGDNLNGCGSEEFEENSTHDNVSIVSPFNVSKVCQVAELKVHLAPDRKDIILRPQKQSTRNSIPIVHSEVVYSFCQALSLRARLAPVESRVIFNPQKSSTKNKITPVVHSEIVYNICLALNLKAELAPQKGDC
ncbi:hypothetical protein NPIL_34711 [Nephila pilipes]|uniref:Uncharacterized protein n=1 Tax=Nephila pilipes TaxID=299642 RepID=A0A8X6IEM8_NEPPI|nr:hypothetical protein NPIL_34711 [Nephila pilipes]